VLRILDKGNLTLDLTKFGFEPKAEQDLMRAILNPYGMVLVTGPTGSGKTTTLYSALSRINQIDVNILTAEDPVEYNLMGINQVLVRSEVGMTFAAALKAFLRQDPNIIMVGEIRDLETGSIAIKAALTGHLVRDRVQRAAGAVRGDGAVERAAAHGAQGRLDRGAAGGGGEGRHAHAAVRRHGEGEARHHNPGGSRERDGGMTAGAPQGLN